MKKALKLVVLQLIRGEDERADGGWRRWRVPYAAAGGAARCSKAPSSRLSLTSRLQHSPSDLSPPAIASRRGRR